MTNKEFSAKLQAVIRRDGRELAPFFGEPCQGFKINPETYVFCSDYSIPIGTIVSDSEGSDLLIVGAEACNGLVIAQAIRLPADV